MPRGATDLLRAMQAVIRRRRFVRVDKDLLPPGVAESAVLMTKKSVAAKKKLSRSSRPVPEAVNPCSKPLKRERGAGCSASARTTSTGGPASAKAISPCGTASARLLARPPLSGSKTEPGLLVPNKFPGVYVLELEGGFVYVGKALDVRERVRQHMAGKGAFFTKLHKPTGRLLNRLGVLVGPGDGPERDETLRQMVRRGADKVRGWKYVSRGLSCNDRIDIESNIREMLDLCRMCGSSKHFCKDCPLLRRLSGNSRARK